MPTDFSFSVDDALALRTVAAPAWNDDGSLVGCLQTHGDETEFIAVTVEAIETTDRSLANVDAPTAATDSGDIAEFAWRPDAPAEAALIVDGAVERFDTATAARTTLSAGDEPHSSPAWHPDGDRLAYVRDGTLWLHDLSTGGVRALTTDHTVADLFGPTPVRWSADGAYLATLIETDGEGLGLLVLDPDGGDDGDGTAAMAWKRTPSATAALTVPAFDWAGDRVLVYAEESLDGSERVYRAPTIDAESGPGTAILSEHDQRVLARDEPVGTDDGRIAVLSAASGYHHVYIIDVATRREAVGDDERPGIDGPGVTQVTSGEFEARGDANETPAWHPDGDQLAYVTNEADVGDRRLHVTAVDGIDINGTTVFDVPGNAVHPDLNPAGQVACVRSGRTTPADIHVAATDTGAIKRVTQAHPDPSRFDSFPEPEPVSFPGANDETIYGYRYAPPDATAGDDRPAVIWCHGGPVRQMRRGFHHMRSYAGFHAFNHVLVSRGYVVLELNYRGGIGYGRAFEHGIHHAMGVDDLTDCVRAAEFLRDDDRVGDRVGLWGLSYGGFLANAVATKTNAVDCVVNFAGIWDWRDWVEYAITQFRTAGRQFAARFGGTPDVEDEAVAERYAEASPCEFAEGIDTPLFALHGTDDPNVPFEQMDGLVADLVDLGKPFEMAYYPEEDHMFEATTTWRDALDRVVPFLETHLEPSGDP
ncbi:MAG: prolyl oligopeptidase family serine peptidase [Halobacteriales archaeon]|nr:prolyl oligopeptidase family serine peptidase [Halobacteriales archaeon]